MSHTNNGKSKKFQIELIPTLNRAVIMSAFIAGRPLTFGIKHDKKTTALQFQFDAGNSLVEDHTVRIEMFRNLENCRFCSTFFKIENEKTTKKDYRGKFCSVKQLYGRNLIQFLHEKYDLHYSDNGRSKQSLNYMNIAGWKLQDADNDLLFYFIERSCFNTVSRMRVIRSAGFQLSTARGSEILERYFVDSEHAIRKVDNTDTLPEFLFEGEDNEEDVIAEHVN